MAERRYELLGRVQSRAGLGEGPREVAETTVIRQRAQQTLGVGQIRSVPGPGGSAQRVEVGLVSHDRPLDGGDVGGADQVGDQALHRGSGAVSQAVEAGGAECGIASSAQVQRAPIGAVAQLPDAKHRGGHEPLVMGAIGVGSLQSRGSYIMKEALGHKGVHYVAVCDVDQRHSRHAKIKVIGGSCWPRRVMSTFTRMPGPCRAPGWRPTLACSMTARCFR